MNFFFGFKNEDFFSRLTIPKFQNSGKTNKKLNIYFAEIKNNKWYLEKIINNEDQNFFYINKTIIDNHRIFFLASDNEIIKFNNTSNGELLDLNNFTNTTPEYRANFKIFNNLGGYSSYQSDYPFKMVQRKGTILSSTFALTNSRTKENFVLIRNIFFKPIIENFKIFVVDIRKKKILFEKDIKTNYSNLIKLENNLINKDCYLISKNYLGIPIYLSSENGHMSFEHTLPPHSYILSSDKFKKVSEIKKQINEIIN
jgi:hypothetical protein